MTAGVYGEITAAGDQIVLAVTGSDWELNRAGAALRHLTPLLTKTEPKGMLLAPLTWSTVCQLGHSFTSESTGVWIPGPKLREWILLEFDRRHAATVEQPATAIQPAAIGDQPAAEGQPAACLVPRAYQLAAAAMIANMGKVFIFDDPGPQPVTTPVWTPDGWRELGDLVPGDIVYDSDGQPAPVVTVEHFGKQPVYRITFNDRTSTLATAEHRWHVWAKNDRTGHNGIKGKTGRIMATSQLLTAGLHSKDRAARFWLPQQPVITGTVSELPLDPYTYGALLGDGSLGGEQLSITCPDNEILLRVASAATAIGTSWKWNTPADRCQNLAFHRTGKLREVLGELSALKYSSGKAVHISYLHACETARRMLLAGLLDTDGTVTNRGAGVEFSSASLQLAAGVAWLARSLGAVVTEAKPQPAGYMKDGQKTWTQDKHRLHMRFPANGPNPFTLPRKAGEWARQAIQVQRQHPPRTFQSIEPAGETDVCCIGLDDNSTHVYLTDTALIPTHNTGKTASTLLGLKARQQAGHELFPMIIVAPSWDICDGWSREISTWAPEWPQPVMYGGPGRGTGGKILLTTYATARLDAADAKAPLVTLKARSVVVDEAHVCRNEKSRQSQAMRRIAAGAQNFVALTGTPIVRDTGNIFPVLAAADPRSYPSRDRFVKRYLQTSNGDYGEVVEGLAPLAEPEFRAVLDGQYRRVSKADVLDQLPPKVYSIRRVEIPEQWRKAYDGMAADMLAQLPEGGELSVMSVLTQLTRLSQLASSACDVEITEEPDAITGEVVKHYEVTLRTPSWKADALLGVLAERPGQQVAVFAESRQLVMIAGQACKEAGYRTGYITGGQRRAERADAITAFQAGELDVILATSGAGSLGITLTAAGTAVMLQRSWSIDQAIQPESRLDRIGQRHSCVEIIDIISKATIDERIRAVLRAKSAQLSALVRDPRIVKELLGGHR